MKVFVQKSLPGTAPTIWPLTWYITGPPETGAHGEVRQMFILSVVLRKNLPMRPIKLTLLTYQQTAAMSATR